MKETVFTKQNKKKWENFEKLLASNQSDPRKISKLFIEISDDLSYAKTFYKNRSVRAYLNGVSKVLFNLIYKSRKTKFSDFTEFWRTELPESLYRSRKQFLISFLVFTVCAFIGVLSSIHDPEFARSILSSGYVDMTLENIEKGDPMAVYKGDDHSDMFLGIMYNNLSVAFLTFVSGLIFSFGSIIILIHNGVMVGTFQYFFIARDLTWESFLTIWLHGTFEISSIILAGGAGLVLGKGLVFPGTLSRWDAFKISSRDGIKIMMGLIPIFVIAAFIEGYLTRHTEVPDAVRLAIIVGSFLFMLFYFVVYPYRIRHRIRDLKKDELSKLQTPDFVFDKTNVLKITEIIETSFSLFNKHIGFYFLILLLSSVLGGVIYASNGFGLLELNENGYFYPSMSALFDYTDYAGLYVLNSGFMAIIATVVCYKLTKSPHFGQKGMFKWAHIIANNIVIALLFNTVFFVDDAGFLYFCAFLLIPVLLLANIISGVEKKAYMICLGESFKLISNSFWKLVIPIANLLLLAFFLIYLPSQLVHEMLTSALFTVTSADDFSQSTVLTFYIAFISMIFMGAFIYFLYKTVNVFYYSAHETTYASNLMGRIQNIGSGKQK